MIAATGWMAAALWDAKTGHVPSWLLVVCAVLTAFVVPDPAQLIAALLIWLVIGNRLLRYMGDADVLAGPFLLALGGLWVVFGFVAAQLYLKASRRAATPLLPWLVGLWLVGYAFKGGG